ncbi:hypothetical protein BC834DRAFT_332060 [Gloeopeniophorella convolvens]|nr:hypothetical protein BC834DRAFT_332060 [Gloeopeniophorella convolvens]
MAGGPGRAVVSASRGVWRGRAGGGRFEGGRAGGVGDAAERDGARAGGRAKGARGGALHRDGDRLRALRVVPVVGQRQRGGPRGGRVGGVGLRPAAEVLADDAVHDAVLLRDEGVLAVEVALEAALALGLDAALELGAGLRADVDHALVEAALDGGARVGGGGGGEGGVALGLHVVDEGEVELGLDVLLECVDPGLGDGAGRERRGGGGAWQRGGGACGEGGGGCRWGVRRDGVRGRGATGEE